METAECSLGHTFFFSEKTRKLSVKPVSSVILKMLDLIHISLKVTHQFKISKISTIEESLLLHWASLNFFKIISQNETIMFSFGHFHHSGKRVACRDTKYNISIVPRRAMGQMVSGKHVRKTDTKNIIIHCKTNILNLFHFLRITSSFIMFLKV